MDEKKKDGMTLDGEKYIPFLSDCTMCDHFNNNGYSCAAFPDGIPSKILKGEVTHKTVIDSQVGDYVCTFIVS